MIKIMKTFKKNETEIILINIMEYSLLTESQLSVKYKLN